MEDITYVRTLFPNGTLGIARDGSPDYVYISGVGYDGKTIISHTAYCEQKMELGWNMSWEPHDDMITPLMLVVFWITQMINILFIPGVIVAEHFSPSQVIPDNDYGPTSYWEMIKSVILIAGIFAFFIGLWSVVSVVFMAWHSRHVL